MTILNSLLTRGYFPKELPPAFFTAQFARYAATKRGRQVLDQYKPVDNLTDCVSYRLALPGPERRHLRIPHPASFQHLARLTSQHFRRLLKKAGASPFSKSRPVYSLGRHRAIQGSVSPPNLARERALARAGASYLLKADVSQFYPSLYTHAIGWAIDPQLRQRSKWHATKLLGKRLDQAVMDLQGKVSQGLPIGNDVSFLLAEIVLGQVDRRVSVPRERCYRGFDDYEIACDSREQAEAALADLVAALHAFRLRINPTKTRIVQLPQPSEAEWQRTLRQQGLGSLQRASEMVQYFDAAFRLREQFPDSPVLMYALGLLFRLRRPNDDVGRVAQSAITQTLLCEPGAAQKAFALLTFWRLNGLALDLRLLGHTIERVILQHRSSGLSSDVSWGLAFCLENQVSLGARAGSVLSALDDDCMTIQALHAHAQGLLAKGFKTGQISKTLRDVDLDGEHWLLGYESVRHGFLQASAAAVGGNALFSDLLRQGVTFYRTRMPPYASIIHTGGAPDWIVRMWMDVLQGKREPKEGDARGIPALGLVGQDLARLGAMERPRDDAVADLLDIYGEEEFVTVMAGEEAYFP